MHVSAQTEASTHALVHGMHYAGMLTAAPLLVSCMTPKPQPGFIAMHDCVLDLFLTESQHNCPTHGAKVVFMLGWRVRALVPCNPHNF